MITIGNFTGEIEDNQYVVVELLNGDTCCCRPCFAFPMIAVPTKKWLDKYSSKYMAVVGFRDNLKERPLLIGMMPLQDTNFPSEGYENNYLILSEQFRLWFADDDKKFVVDVLDGGTICFGDKDVTEAGVLGDKNEQVLKDLATGIKDIVESIGSSAVFAGDGGATFKANLVSNLADTLAKMTAIISTDAEATKSETVKLK